MHVDFIGDVHGHFKTLEKLLAHMGYERQGGVYGHPERTAVFLGDLIDRGPDSADVVELVSRMQARGHAHVIMGNHELNALAYHTQNPGKPGTFLRAHTNRNTAQHQATLDSFAKRGPDALNAALAWMRTLPLWMESSAFNAVHACWHPRSMRTLKKATDIGNRIRNNNALVRMTAPGRGNPLVDATETVLKGLESDLPDGCSFADKDGHIRRRARIKWWDADIDTPWRDALVTEPGLAEQLPDAPIGAPDMQPYNDTVRPVFFGHYWMEGVPRTLSDNVLCLDYSCGKGGPICAYRFDGESTLDNTKIIALDNAG